MSYDLILFERTEVINDYETFLQWLEMQTRWEEDRDYCDVVGTKPRLTECFMELKKQFPPLNGPYCLSDEEAFENEETERHLTDYSIGGQVIYASFGWSVAEEAYQSTKALADMYQLGFFDTQRGEVFCPGLAVARVHNEQGREYCATWEALEKELDTLESPKRGTSNQDNAFVTVWFQTGEDLSRGFMQCAPSYVEVKKGWHRWIFPQAGLPKQDGYTVEVSTGEKIFATHVVEKGELIKLFQDYYEKQKLPDLSGWRDTGLL